MRKIHWIILISVATVITGLCGLNTFFLFKVMHERKILTGNIDGSIDGNIDGNISGSVYYGDLNGSMDGYIDGNISGTIILVQSRRSTMKYRR